MSGGRLCVGVRGGRGPASRAKTGRIEDGIVDIDQTVADAVFDCRQI